MSTARYLNISATVWVRLSTCALPFYLAVWKCHALSESVDSDRRRQLDEGYITVVLRFTMLQNAHLIDYRIESRPWKFSMRLL